MGNLSLKLIRNAIIDRCGAGIIILNKEDEDVLIKPRMVRIFFHIFYKKAK